MLLDKIKNASPHTIVRLMYWCDAKKDYSEKQVLKNFNTCTI